VREYPLLAEAGLLIVYARLSGPNGSRLVRLAVDTGCTTSMIPPQAALAIGCNPVGATRLRETLTASGKEFVPIVTVPRLQIFERALRRVPMACHELPSESPVEGLLGLDLLTRMNAMLDLRRARIRIPSHSR